MLTPQDANALVRKHLGDVPRATHSRFVAHVGVGRDGTRSPARDDAEARLRAVDERAYLADMLIALSGERALSLSQLATISASGPSRPKGP